MKLHEMKAAGLVIKFDQECRKLYSLLREKYVFTREFQAVETVGINHRETDVNLLKNKEDDFDGDKFHCVSEFYIDDVIIYITYGGENFRLDLNFSVNRSHGEHAFDFDDIFNFRRINELRKTSFLYISDEQAIERIMERYRSFLFLYLPIILEISRNEKYLDELVDFHEKKYENVNILDAWYISRADAMFEKGDYEKAAKFYGKRSALLSYLQSEKYQRSSHAISSNVERMNLRREFELENSFHDFNIVKRSIMNDFIWMSLVFLLWPLCTALLFPVFYGIYHFYFLEVMKNRNELLYMLKPDIGYCVIPSMLAGVMAAYYPAYWTMKRIKRNKIREYLSTKKSSDTRLTVLSSICIALILVGLIQMVRLGLNWRIEFTNSAIYDGTEFFTVSKQRYEYKEIEGVYMVQHDRYDPQREFNFYVIKYKNGSFSDLSDFCDQNDEIQNKMIPILKQKGVRIVIVDNFKSIFNH